jgi:FKBP-type peptidyl-prolyl cis-trans isomerase FkpA
MTSFTRIRIAVLVVVIAAAFAVSACGSSSPAAPDQSSVTYSQTDLTVGTGAEATPGKTASVQYILWLYSETGVDKKGQQIDQGQFAFLLGANQVVKGFDTAVTGMKVGGIRRAIIPPSLAYGSTGSQNVPPNAALVFEIGLAGVQ